jgi:iron(III) transport system substrate-binding protein
MMENKMHRKLFIFLILLFAQSTTSLANSLGIYTHRQPFLLEPILEAYTNQTGITFKTVYAPKGLAERLKSEGDNTEADLVLTVDISRIKELADTGLLVSIQSDKLNKQVPQHLRDVQNKWTALSLRARVIAISKKRVDRNEISTIEELADPKWEGRICSRKGSHVYNRAVLASLIAHNGEDAARDWALGLVNNLSRRPQGNDRSQAKAIFSGQCDITLMNTYYYGKMKFATDKPEQKQWANSLELIFFNQNGRGQHVNISAAGITKGSKNKDMATSFLEWLTSPEAQKIYTEVNFEYPVNPKSNLSKEVSSWGPFKMDKLEMNEIARLSPNAQKIINETGW